MLEDGSNSKDGVLSYVSMTMLETGSSGRKERFDKFSFSKLAQEPQSIASDVFIWMLEIISDAVALIFSVTTLYWSF